MVRWRGLAFDAAPELGERDIIAWGDRGPGVPFGVSMASSSNPKRPPRRPPPEDGPKDSSKTDDTTELPFDEREATPLNADDPAPQRVTTYPVRPGRRRRAGRDTIGTSTLVAPLSERWDRRSSSSTPSTDRAPASSSPSARGRSSSVASSSCDLRLPARVHQPPPCPAHPAGGAPPPGGPGQPERHLRRRRAGRLAARAARSASGSTSARRCSASACPAPTRAPTTGRRKRRLAERSSGQLPGRTGSGGRRLPARHRAGVVDRPGCTPSGCRS